MRRIIICTSRFLINEAIISRLCEYFALLDLCVSSLRIIRRSRRSTAGRRRSARPARRRGRGRGTGAAVIYMCIYIYIYTCIYISLSLYIYIYREREREYPAAAGWSPRTACRPGCPRGSILYTTETYTPPPINIYSV